jgi:hypothetical protein
VASERQKKRPQTRETQKQKKQKKKNGGVGGDAQGLAHCLFLVARCLKNKKYVSDEHLLSGQKTAFGTHRPQPPESNRAARAVRVIKQPEKISRFARINACFYTLQYPPFFLRHKIFLLCLFVCLLSKLPEV